MISILNIVSFTALILTTALILKRVIQVKKKGLIAILMAMFLLSLSELTNILEHLNIAPETDEWEDVLEIVFFPLLILSLHITMLEDELNNRKISESKFQAIYNNASTFIGLLDHEGRLLHANDASTKASNVPFESLVGVYFWDTPWWSHSEIEKQKIIEAIKVVQKGEPSQFHTTHQDENGQLIYIDHSLTPVFDANNEVVYIIPEGRNVTALKLALDELEKHKTILEELVAEKTKELNATLKISKQLNEKLYRSNQQLEQSNLELKKKSEYLKQTLNQLKTAQQQLIESEKWPHWVFSQLVSLMKSITLLTSLWEV